MLGPVDRLKLTEAFRAGKRRKKAVPQLGANADYGVQLVIHAEADRAVERGEVGKEVQYRLLGAFLDRHDDEHSCARRRRDHCLRCQAFS